MLHDLHIALEAIVTLFTGLVVPLLLCVDNNSLGQFVSGSADDFEDVLWVADSRACPSLLTTRGHLKRIIVAGFNHCLSYSFQQN